MDVSNGFICPECKLIFSQQDLLTSHFENTHSYPLITSDKVNINPSCSECKIKTDNLNKLKHLLKEKIDKITELTAFSNNLNILNEQKIKNIQDLTNKDITLLTNQIKDISVQNSSINSINSELERSKLFFKESSSKYKRMCEELSLKHDNLTAEYNSLTSIHSKCSILNSRTDSLDVAYASTIQKSLDSFFHLKKIIKNIYTDVNNSKKYYTNNITKIKNYLHKLIDYQTQLKQNAESKSHEILLLKKNNKKLQTIVEKYIHEKEVFNKQTEENINNSTLLEQLTARYQSNLKITEKLRYDLELSSNNEKKTYENYMALNNQLNTKINELNDKILDKDKCIQSLKQQISIETGQLKDLDLRYKETLDSYNFKISDLENKILLQNSDISSKAYEHKSLCDKINELQLLKSDFERSFNSSKIRNETLKHENEELTNVIEQLKFKLETSESRFKENEVRSRESMLALCELGAQNQKLQSIVSCLQGNKWRDDSTITRCEQCLSVFTLTVRKHHCRICGGIFCDVCTSNEVSLASHKKDVRVCSQCFENLSSLNQI